MTSSSYSWDKHIFLISITKLSTCHFPDLFSVQSPTLASCMEQGGKCLPYYKMGDSACFAKAGGMCFKCMSYHVNILITFWKCDFK